MKKWLKRIGLVLAVVFLAIQFYPTPRNTGEIHGPKHIAKFVEVPAGVEAILVKACYDCHSNGTRYPWYARLQPVAWWMGTHVDDGKRHLNFSEFGGYEAKKRKTKLELSYDAVDLGHMPLPSYTWAHRDAVLTDAEKKTFLDWCETALEELGR